MSEKQTFHDVFMQRGISRRDFLGLRACDEGCRCHGRHRQRSVRAEYRRSSDLPGVERVAALSETISAQINRTDELARGLDRIAPAFSGR